MITSQAGQQPADFTDVRATNLAVVLRYIRANAPCSRADIAASTGLNKATVSSLVAELIDRRLLRETGLTETPHRPAGHHARAGRRGLRRDRAGGQHRPPHRGRDRPGRRAAAVLAARLRRAHAAAGPGGRRGRRAGPPGGGQGARRGPRGARPHGRRGRAGRRRRRGAAGAQPGLARRRPARRAGAGARTSPDLPGRGRERRQPGRPGRAPLRRRTPASRTWSTSTARPASAPASSPTAGCCAAGCGFSGEIGHVPGRPRRAGRAAAAGAAAWRRWPGSGRWSRRVGGGPRPGAISNPRSTTSCAGPAATSRRWWPRCARSASTSATASPCCPMWSIPRSWCSAATSSRWRRGSCRRPRPSCASGTVAPDAGGCRLTASALGQVAAAIGGAASILDAVDAGTLPVPQQDRAAPVRGIHRHLLTARRGWCDPARTHARHRRGEDPTGRRIASKTSAARLLAQLAVSKRSSAGTERNDERPGGQAPSGTVGRPVPERVRDLLRPAHAGREDRPAAPAPAGASRGWASARSAPAPRPCTAWPGSARRPCSRRPWAWPARGTRTWCARSARPSATRPAACPPQGPDPGRPQRLGAGGQPAARPPLGPQRGGLRRGPAG